MCQQLIVALIDTVNGVVVILNFASTQSGVLFSNLHLHCALIRLIMEKHWNVSTYSFILSYTLFLSVRLSSSMSSCLLYFQSLLIEPLTCKPDSEFRCEDESACIDAVARCDSVQDCTDGSDEKDCGKWWLWGLKPEIRGVYTHRIKDGRNL